MRFFTSLIVLVPLVFSVVALPASTQDVSAIISGIKDLTAQLTTVENVLQNLTQANVAKIASQVASGLNQSTILTNYVIAALNAHPRNFNDDEGQDILISEVALASSFTETQLGLLNAANLFHITGYYSRIASFVEPFGNEFNKAISGIQAKYSDNLATEGNVISAAVIGQLNILDDVYNSVGLGSPR
ncbi:hypothetical protein K443DRAFT_504098 [Laccaria amethystina LaAM-08-1]|uniref:Uncharacterized protein n=1 Tax=Laccaria amethystina LaAM-08-1 TaxID=1095629 RepID=A0A0C9Y4M2_9AGAR|nr:hypothetical protein K443DRAFT_504098 [Laccaria amethystina LaAM-08-1]